MIDFESTVAEVSVDKDIPVAGIRAKRKDDTWVVRFLLKALLRVLGNCLGFGLGVYRQFVWGSGKAGFSIGAGAFTARTQRYLCAIFTESIYLQALVA